MNNLRFNPFNQIHKGLRAMLYDTGLSIQRTDFSKEEQARVTFKKIEKVLWLFEGHANVEDSIVFPLLKSCAPRVVDDFEQQHETDHALAHELQNIMTSYNFARTTTEMLQAGTKVLHAFNEFAAFNLQHMNKEETIINDLLWQHYTDVQLLKLQGDIVASIPPDKNEHYGRWMIRGINDSEMTIWLQKIKQTAPGSVYDCIYAIAAQELPEERWVGISHMLNEKATTIG